MIAYKEKALLVENTLIIADVHLGYESEAQKQGVLLPSFHYQKMIEQIETLLEETKPETVIINGDLKHGFGSITNQEWREILKFIDAIQKQAQLIIIRGNHDPILQPIARKRNIEVLTHYSIDDVYICHGDSIPEDDNFKKAKTIVIGHIHPTYTLKEGPKAEKYKCFLKTKWKRKTLYVLPSFNAISEGTDIQFGEINCPFFDAIRKAEVTIVEEGKEYQFGKVIIR